MSERQTGATDERAAAMYDAYLGFEARRFETHERPEPWAWEELSDDDRQYWREVTDAARVPTDDELAEWRRLVGGADEGYVDLPSLDVLRAYLERQR